MQALVERVGRGHAGCRLHPAIGAHSDQIRTRNGGGGGGIFRIQPQRTPAARSQSCCGLQRRLVEPEARRYRRLLQQVEHAACREAAGGQVKGLVEHACHRVFARAAEASDAPRDAARRRRGAEHSLDQRRGGLQVGRQHHHVGRSAAHRRCRHAANRPSRRSCNTSSSRVREWQTCTSMLRSLAAGRTPAGGSSSRSRIGVVQPRQQVAAGVGREGGVFLHRMLALEQQADVGASACPRRRAGCCRCRRTCPSAAPPATTGGAHRRCRTRTRGTG